MYFGGEAEIEKKESLRHMAKLLEIEYESDKESGHAVPSPLESQQIPSIQKNPE